MLFWSAEATARVVHVRIGTDGTTGPTLVRYDPEGWSARDIGRSTPDGYHLVVAPSSGARHHLIFQSRDPPPANVPLTPIIPWDAWHPERLEAARAFWKFAARPRLSTASSIPEPKAHPRGLKIAYMTWALDLGATGASERDIHRAVLGEPPAAWEDSGARSRMRTLVATARRWCDGAAFRLLKAPRPI
ncbi:DNA -binding domain-containing protein [Acidiphilium multivorum]|uniref:DNA -binding domain-containing protein n=1 Tax=Acidiphilium multivorum TaxID=62140 RepID=UPI001B8C3858|nr:DUF2285 domain-containing protein [Acidiphilium multivorum]MBS3025028.1 DUF2285 domain-containing protein [Acidiphilium multivorum]